MTLKELKDTWIDTPEHHTLVHETLCELVNNHPELNAHRTFVENHVMGFGERSFQWMHKAIVDEMPEEFSFLEIGVFKSQILSLYRLLADLQGKKVTRYGVTPLDSSGGVWESNYEEDIKFLHDQLNIEKDYRIFKGLSTESSIIELAYQASPYDVVFIDGGHDYDTVVSDLKYYAPMVKEGGYLIIDDACNDLNMQFGYFQGINEVTKATLEYLQGNNDWEFITNVVHNRIYKYGK